MKRNFLLFTAILGVVIIALSAGNIRAQGNLTPTPTLRAVTDNEVNQISKNLFCPVCENVPLNVCETDACQRWREQVRDLLAQGYTEEQIQQYFIERFGQKTVGTPTTPIAQLLTVILPLGLIGLIGLVAAFNLIRWRGNTQSEHITAKTMPADDNPSDEDDYRARLEAELKERD
jgi:cytochrome c-type biogenesis protein CcmH